MSTTLLFGTVTDPSDVPSSEAFVVAELFARIDGPGVGFVPVDQTEIISATKIQTASDGTWSLALIPNDQITPTGTFWRIVYSHKFNAWGPSVQFASLPTSGTPVWIGDVLVDLPVLPQISSVESVNGQTGVVIITAEGLGAATTTALTAETVRATTAEGLLIPLTQKDAPGGVASLDGGGKVPTSELPALTLGQTFTVNSQAAMLALAANVGDDALRTDLTPQEVFLLTALPASTLANWVPLVGPGAVISVDGQQGVVNLSAVYDAIGLAAAETTRALAAEAALTALINAGSPPLTLSRAGFMTEGILHGMEVAANACTIHSVIAVLETPPQGRDAVFDVFLNGTTIFTTTANRPTIAAGTQVFETVTPDITAASALGLFTASVVQTGLPTTEGSDLTLKIITRP
jgi:hypothetical protein